MLSADFLIFSANRSFLLRKRMMEVSMKNLLLQIESNSIRDSCMRFCGGGQKPHPCRLFAMMTSVTASKTNWMLLVSVAQMSTLQLLYFGLQLSRKLDDIYINRAATEQFPSLDSSEDTPYIPPHHLLDEILLVSECNGLRRDGGDRMKVHV
ncbi:hypothetical protein EYF80_040292 [Liparis tanakae]|uniref:Uncharacterized protein n=1 Tax=Liparis tanakae TaxID=230148 RepID=A0A4Z2G7H7_9TELE|nr:hypothetical protein EYF80_040292 [Liparis tanakae]